MFVQRDNISCYLLEFVNLFFRLFFLIFKLFLFLYCELDPGFLNISCSGQVILVTILDSNMEIERKIIGGSRGAGESPLKGPGSFAFKMGWKLVPHYEVPEGNPGSTTENMFSNCLLVLKKVQTTWNECPLAKFKTF